MTFTWPADLPQKALWGTLPGQVASKTVHLAGKKSKNCLWDTCSGGTSGQVNVTRTSSISHPLTLDDYLFACGNHSTFSPSCNSSRQGYPSTDVCIGYTLPRCPENDYI